jgi:hypothetical protein
MEAENSMIVYPVKRNLGLRRKNVTDPTSGRLIGYDCSSVIRTGGEISAPSYFLPRKRQKTNWTTVGIKMRKIYV